MCIFNPLVIFATSTPYNILSKYYSDKLNGAYLLKLPHPANWNLSSKYRYLDNFFTMVAGLELAGVIKPDEAENISKIAYSGYCELIENDEKYVFRHADYKC